MAVMQYSTMLNTVATTVNSGGTTTLVNTSATIQTFSGSANQTVLLPVATTFTKSGVSYQFYNFSTGSVSVQYQDSTAFQTIAANSTLIVNLYDNTSVNGKWTSLTNSTVPAVNPPTIQRFLSGTGTYTTPSGPTPVYLKIRAIGGGGGGGGQNASTGVDQGGTGGTTTFGTSLITCTGGTGGATADTVSRPGGTVTLGGGLIIIVSASGVLGGAGNSGFNNASADGIYGMGGMGGASPLGGAGSSGGGLGNSAGPSFGTAALSNSGSGGGGDGFTTNTNSGSGGSSGGYAEVIIVSPGTSYAYSVGVGGTAGGSANPGGSGVIIVEEYYY